MKNTITRAAFASLIVLGLMLVGQSNAKINLEDAVGIWLFDDRQGNEVKDSSGKENHGKFARGAEPKWVKKGRFEGALEFDGEDDYIVVSHSDSLALSDKISISVWVYPDGQQPPTKDGVTASCAGILEKNDNTGYYLKHWDGINSGAIIWRFGGARKWDIGQTAGILWEWQHLAATWDGEVGYFYVNGELRSTTPHKGRIKSGDDWLTIGFRSHNGHSGWFKGMIDDIAIFNAVLDDEDIELLSEQGVGRILDLLPVSPSGKLATTWATVKARYRE